MIMSTMPASAGGSSPAAGACSWEKKSVHIGVPQNSAKVPSDGVIMNTMVIKDYDQIYTTFLYWNIIKITNQTQTQILYQ